MIILVPKQTRKSALRGTYTPAGSHQAPSLLTQTTWHMLILHIEPQIPNDRQYPYLVCVREKAL